MKIELEKLRTFLIDSGLITEGQFEEAKNGADKEHKKVEEMLVAKGFINEIELIKLRAYILGIPFVNLEKEIIAPEVLKVIPEPIARNHNIIAFRKGGQELEVAMLDPEDLRTIEFIRKKANLHILPRLTTPQSIKNALRQYQKSLEAEFGDLISQDAGIITPVNEEATPLDKDLKKVAEELPVIRIVDTLMKHAILQRASDIHIEPGEKEMIVRYRIDGILRDAMVLPKSVAGGISARIKVLSNLKLDEHRLPQDGRFKIETEDYRYSIRVSVLPVFDGEKIVMRLLSEGTKALSLEAIGLMGDPLEKVQYGIKKPVGMILITGPTGSGKTTTLYSIMDILNTIDVNISTVEDPIEYRMLRVNQTQVYPKIGLTFANGLRSLLRQDPDIIMVGEIRDNETASLAINASLTGHMVLSTLHTNNAAGAIPRLIDMKAEPFLIASTLNLVIAQRLVRKLSSGKEKYKLKEAQIKDLSRYCDLDKVLEVLRREKVVSPKATFKTIDFYRSKSQKDESTGYLGRIGIFEVLPVTETIKDLIIKGSSSDHIEKQAKSEGMRTMVEDGFIKAVQGLTSLEEVLRVITE